MLGTISILCNIICYYFPNLYVHCVCIHLHTMCAYIFYDSEQSKKNYIGYYMKQFFRTELFNFHTVILYNLFTCRLALNIRIYEINIRCTYNLANEKNKYNIKHWSTLHERHEIPINHDKSPRVAKIKTAATQIQKPDIGIPIVIALLLWIIGTLLFIALYPYVCKFYYITENSHILTHYFSLFSFR